jgi:UDP-N-acetylmuramoyl-tripeptide--D-alanyl-D-alanine ligase
MNAFWTLDRMAAALTRRAPCALPHGSTELRAISTDTRTLQPGDAFVALQGDRFDAHDYLDVAVQAGAAALIVSRPPALGTYSVPVFIVDDTLRALGDLASYWRGAWGKTVVAIAGSNGKTSTKELVRAALGSVYEVHATTGNLNNRIGVPLTLLAIPNTVDIAVVEVGTSLPGEIAILRDIVRPDIAVMTCIAEEHLEGLGDLDGVLREEAAIFDGVPLAVTPASQPFVAQAAHSRAHRVVSAGLDAGELIAEAWSIAPDGKGAIIMDGVSIGVPFRGLHNLRNTMLALAVARECGITIADIARGIAAATAPAMRTVWQTIGSTTIINDAYNANPASMRAALDMLAAADASQRVAILGTMRELGPRAADYHDEIARAALQSPVDLIAGVGEMGTALQRIAPNDARVVRAPDVEDLWPLLAPRVLPDAVILLKASRGVRLERIVPYITTWATT